MNHTPLHSFFVFNGELKPVSEYMKSENSGGVYEVLRVVKGIPLFLEDHLKRFYSSAAIAGKSIRFTQDEIISFLNRLIRENGVNEGNILISCRTNLKAFFIAHKYPNPAWYEKGVECGLLFAERQNPNAKIFQTPIRQKADELMEKKGYYEVLLVDHLNRITEGSRSNVFFVKDNHLITPPGNEVLLGITRQKTIQLAYKAGLRFREQEIGLKEVPAFHSAFITGTSPKILPLYKIEDWIFHPQNKVVQQLIRMFDVLIADYIRAVR